tara:strand:+ start:189 stop:419 length:231 start_codon:yes stop_codon:yes gene_type:complete
MIGLLFFAMLFAIGGASFALMYNNIKSISEMDRPIKRHPEAPNPGEEVMYVDVSQMNVKQFAEQKERLEDLFNQNN